MTRIALATTAALTDVDVDDAALLAALPEAELAAWETPTDWAAYDLVVLRSTWNYIDRLDEFLGWAESVAAVTRLVNPVPVIRWNTDKRYLAQLAAAGVPVVPSLFVAPGEQPPDDALAGRIVVKPAVGNGSNGAALLDGDPTAAAAHVAMLHAAGRTALIQPYLEQVDTLGEKALVHLGGSFSHAATKGAILSKEMSFSTGVYADEEISPATASDAEIAVARAVLDATAVLLPDAADLAYARVDLLPTDDGPVLLELELTEPSLFLTQADGAADRAAAAIRDLLR
ncbi:hypothetical protein RN607_00340 [Demequina capsici]|uniref:ATP-grasp domain-containing protein n=1 Tax=Demequina capsici TaxID=3075620 RepID=A0AA96FD62_9MICO|nr:hypothetical protein [Demequina sp. PMTSA13]WNM27484.1 hypothetical protein RN607_00340 [Demequina sp. PMTSA13]